MKSIANVKLNHPKTKVEITITSDDPSITAYIRNRINETFTPSTTKKKTDDTFKEIMRSVMGKS
jgi:hypothetical protein